MSQHSLQIGVVVHKNLFLFKNQWWKLNSNLKEILSITIWDSDDIHYSRNSRIKRNIWIVMQVKKEISSNKKIRDILRSLFPPLFELHNEIIVQKTTDKFFYESFLEMLYIVIRFVSLLSFFKLSSIWMHSTETRFHFHHTFFTLLSPSFSIYRLMHITGVVLSFSLSLLLDTTLSHNLSFLLVIYLHSSLVGPIFD